QGHPVAGADRNEMRPLRPRLQSEDVGEEFGRPPFVRGRNDRVVELHCHVILPTAGRCHPAIIRYGMMVSSASVNNAISQMRKAFGQPKSSGSNPNRCFQPTSPAPPCSIAP